jgi:hypothetical protein
MIEEANTPESFKKGEQFEKYVREYLFTEEHYDLIERTHNYTTNKDYVEASLKPDFKLRDKKNKKEFYLEAKFRSCLYDNKIMWSNDKQLKRYIEISKEKPVFIIIGMGDKPNYPDGLFLLPLEKAKYTGLFINHAEKFEIPFDKSVKSNILWSK